MGFSRHRHALNVASFRNYQEAKLYYDNTNQIRGRDKYNSGVPLRNDRRDRDTSLIELDNGDMALRLYSTNIIIWHKDNETITVNVFYNSRTTVNWANAYVPDGLRVCQRYGYTLLNDFYVCTNPMTFKKEGNGWTLLTKPTQMRVERFDRTKARKVREQSEEFYEYLRTMCAFELTDEGLKSLKESTEPFAKVLFKFGCRYTRYNSLRTHYFDFEATKRTYAENMYRKSGAYYMEDLPLGTLHKNMVVKL